MKKTKSIITAIVVVAVLALSIGIAVSGIETVATYWALIPPVVAFGLALITKEVYSSLFIGIVT